MYLCNDICFIYHITIYYIACICIYYVHIHIYINTSRRYLSIYLSMYSDNLKPSTSTPVYLPKRNECLNSQKDP